MLIPFQFAFGTDNLGASSLIIYVIDFFFLWDIFFNFKTSYRFQGTEVTDKKMVASQYARKNFAIDLLATIPLDILFLGRPEAQIFNISLIWLLRSFRLLRIVRLFVIFTRWEDFNRINAGYLRVMKFLALVLLFGHWITCGWFVLPSIENFPADNWVMLSGIRFADRFTQYIRSFYWTITTMTTVGYGDITPHGNGEYLFTSMVMLIGASLYAYIIGNIASLLSNIDSTKASFWNRMETVSQYLNYREVPFELSGRVRNYYEYIWARHRGLREDMFFDDLPNPLRLDILHYLTQELLEKVPLFKFASPSLRNVLLLVLIPQTYSPDGHVTREGELGKEIFFVSRGKLEISSNDGKNTHGTLESGDYFGDISLLFGEKRTASVKSLTFCEIFILEKTDFNKIKEEYPEFKEVLKKASSNKPEKLMELVIDGIVL
jgi:hypothetical protein